MAAAAARFESLVQQKVDANEIPNASFYASDATGGFQYHSIFGYSSLEPRLQPFAEDDYVWAASCTKLFTSIAVLKLVEQGRLRLDDAADAVLPELAALKIITQSDPDFEFATPKNKITYRHLLTHTSGLAYVSLNPHLSAWRSKNPAEGTGVTDVFSLPLIFEPGTAWSYGCGLDWAGLAVERVAGTKLSDFMERHIFTPAGVPKDFITFFPHAVPGAKLAAMAQRTADGRYVAGNQGMPAPAGTDCHGGHGTYIRGGEYVTVLRSLLADDGRVLGRATAAELLRPQLTEAQRRSLNDVVFRRGGAGKRDSLARRVAEGKLDHALCGFLDTEGQPGWRGKGTVMWGGMPNLSWFLDREKGLCGYRGAQLMPTGDAVYVGLTVEFEKAMYALAGKTW